MQKYWIDYDHSKESKETYSIRKKLTAKAWLGEHFIIAVFTVLKDEMTSDSFNNDDLFSLLCGAFAFALSDDGIDFKTLKPETPDKALHIPFFFMDETFQLIVDTEQHTFKLKGPLSLFV